MTARLLAGLLAVVAASGCSVASIDDGGYDPATNQCESDADCAAGTCNVQLGVCHAAQGAFGTLLFEVTPPANQGQVAGIDFILTQELSPIGGPVEIPLGSLLHVTFKMTPTKGEHQGECTAAYGAAQLETAPVKISFTPSARLLGLTSQKYTTSTQSDGVDYRSDVLLPADEYDLYIEPDLESGDYDAGACTVKPPPQLVKLTLDHDDSLTLQLQAPKLLVMDVLWPKSRVTANQPEPLTGWVVEMLDPSSGRALSLPATLALDASVQDNTHQHYAADLEYSEAVSGSQAGQELVRLRPPKGVSAPTLVFERKAIEAFTTGKAKIEQLEALPQPVVLQGTQLFDADLLAPVSGTVRFISTKLDLVDYAKPGTQALFEISVEAVDGVLPDVSLLPGEYDVYVAPEANAEKLTKEYASSKTQLSVASSPAKQSGKTIAVLRVSEVGGTVLTPGGDPAVGATVQAIPSPGTVLTALEMALDDAMFKPQASSDIVANDGAFLIQADPGTFDFSVRPPDGTGFAWFVRPNVDVESGARDLGSVSLPLPVVYTGVVTVPGAVPVPNALIRAYVYLNEGGYTADRAGAKSVLQIAETRANADGTFALFLPSQLN